MSDLFLSKLGAGVLFAWLALPLLLKVSQARADVRPEARERTLLWALGFGALLLFAPFLPSLTVLKGAATRAPTVVTEVLQALPEQSAPASTLPPLAALALLFFAALALHAFGLVRAAVLQGRALRGLTDAPSEQKAQFDELARSLGLTPPRLRLSSDAGLPYVFGLLRPTVVVPTELLLSLDSQALGLALRHELLHVVRGDIRRRLLAQWLCLPFAFHPSARRAVRELHLLQEVAVDALAAKADPHRYATLLLDVAAHHRFGPAVPGAVGLGPTALTRRIAMLAAPTSRRSDALSRALLSAAALLLGGSALLLPRVSLATDSSEVSTGTAISLSVGQTKVLDMSGVKKVALGDPSVVDLGLEAKMQLVLKGLKPGHTELHVWRTEDARVDFAIDVK